MSQFALHRNLNPASQTRFPLLLDIQSDLFEPLATRMVVPLAPVESARACSMKTLTPTLQFQAKEYLMLTPQVAGIPTRELGPIVGNLASAQETITAAVDLLLSRF